MIGSDNSDDGDGDDHRLGGDDEYNDGHLVGGEPGGEVELDVHGREDQPRGGEGPLWGQHSLLLLHLKKGS